MNAPALIARLSAAGIRLTRHGDQLIAAPRGALTDEARSLIRDHKAELLAALTVESDPRPDPRYAERTAELRCLVEAIARMAPTYWTDADIEEAVAIGSSDLDNALLTFGALAEGYAVGS